MSLGWTKSNWGMWAWMGATRIGIAAPVNGQPIILSIGIGVKMAIIAGITVNLIIV